MMPHHLLAMRVRYRRLGVRSQWERSLEPIGAHWPHRAERPCGPWMTVERTTDDGVTYTFRVACQVSWRRDNNDELVPYVSSAMVATGRGTYRYTHLRRQEERQYLRLVGAMDDDGDDEDEDE